MISLVKIVFLVLLPIIGLITWNTCTPSGYTSYTELLLSIVAAPFYIIYKLLNCGRDHKYDELSMQNKQNLLLDTEEENNKYNKKLDVDDTFTTPDDYDKAKDMWFEGKDIGVEEGYFDGYREGLREGLAYEFDNTEDNKIAKQIKEENSLDEISKVLNHVENIYNKLSINEDELNKDVQIKEQFKNLITKLNTIDT